MLGRIDPLEEPAAVVEPARRLDRDVERFAMWSARVSVIGLFVFALGVVLYLGQYVFAPVVAGILVGFTLGPFSSRLERHGFSPASAASTLVLSLCLAVGLLIYTMAVPLETWSARLPEVGNRLVVQWEQLRGPIDKLKEVEKKVQEAASGGRSVAEVTVKQRGIVSNVISSAADVVTRVLLFIGTVYFFLATRTSLRRACLRWCPTLRTKLSVARIVRDTESYLSRYVAAITVINIGFGVIVGLAMYLLGLPQPYLWGAMAGVLNFAYFVGPAVMTLILLGVGLVTFPDPVFAFAPPIVFIVLNVLEGQFVTPTILGERLTLNPLAVFISISFWLWLWGPVGAFLAVPIVIIVAMTIYHIVPSVAPAGTVARVNAGRLRRGGLTRLRPPRDEPILRQNL